MAELLGVLLAAIGYALEAIGISRPDKKKRRPAPKPAVKPEDGQ